MEVMQTAQRQVGTGHPWLLKEAREPARWISGRKGTPEVGVCMMFNEKQVGQGGWSEKGVSGRRVQALDITLKEAGSHQRVPNRRAT